MEEVVEANKKAKKIENILQQKKSIPHEIDDSIVRLNLSKSNYDSLNCILLFIDDIDNEKLLLEGWEFYKYFAEKNHYWTFTVEQLDMWFHLEYADTRVWSDSDEDPSDMEDGDLRYNKVSGILGNKLFEIKKKEKKFDPMNQPKQQWSSDQCSPREAKEEWKRSPKANLSCFFHILERDRTKVHEFNLKFEGGIPIDTEIFLGERKEGDLRTVPTHDTVIQARTAISPEDWSKVRFIKQQLVNFENERFVWSDKGGDQKEGDDEPPGGGGGRKKKKKRTIKKKKKRKKKTRKKNKKNKTRKKKKRKKKKTKKKKH